MRLIDADELKKTLDSKCDICPDKNTNWCKVVCFYNDIEFLIDNAPTIIWCSETSDGLPLMDLRPRPQGEWKPKLVSFGTCTLQGFKCDCGRIVMQKENFCPYCGAEMTNCSTWNIPPKRRKT